MKPQLVEFESKVTKQIDDVFSELDTTVELVRQELPTLAAFALVVIDREYSVQAYVMVGDHSPLHKFQLPDLCRTAILGEVIT